MTGPERARWFRRPLALMVAAALAAAWPRVARTEDSPRVSVSDARAALLGTLRGGYRCRGPIALEADITDLGPSGPNTLKITGAFKVIDEARHPPLPAVATALQGTYDTATGLLRLETVAGAPAPRSPLSLTVAKDAFGPGLTGTLDGAGAACGPVTLGRADGAGALEGLPRPTAEVAFQQSHPPPFPLLVVDDHKGSSDVYWLELASRLGHAHASYVLGMMYEKGIKASRDHAKALHYYQAAADKGDVPAQAALGSLYASADGNLRDPAQARRWTKLAAAANELAIRVCTSPAAVTAISKMMTQAMNDPMARGLQLFAELLSQTNIDAGSFRIIDVTAYPVQVAGGPFRCEVTGRHVGLTIDAIPGPDFELRGYDRFGIPMYHDNRTENFIRDHVAQGMQGLINAVPFGQTISVEPLANGRYRLGIAQGSLSREYSDIIETR
jgi:Sel1 repeat